MSENQRHFQLEIQDLLDGRLDPEQREAVETHLQLCEKCHKEFEALRWMKRVARIVSNADALPQGLSDRVQNALDQESKKPVSVAPGFFQRREVLAAAAVLVMALLAGIVYRNLQSENLPALVTHDYQNYQAQQLSLQKITDDVVSMESFFKEEGVPFHTRVFDLGMMNYNLLGGSVHRLGGRTSALFVYSGPNRIRMICQMFLGTIGELPSGAEVREKNGIKFYVYRIDQVTSVFWQEGDIICALASDSNPEEVIQLAFAKAVKI